MSRTSSQELARRDRRVSRGLTVVGVLALPLASGDEQTALHVTGDFVASAPA